jgi:two-component system cell cycle response regulator
MAKVISEEVTVVADMAMGPTPRRSKQGAHLIVLSGHNVGQVFNLARARTAIGREEQADIQIMDAGISRQHAEIIRDKEGQYLLRDAGSRNGTFANNHRVEDTYQLQDGDKIQLGVMTVLKFAYTDDTEAEYAQAMYDAAHRDGLTEVYNRRYFEEKLVAELPYAVRHGRPLALLMLDLDHFKQVNDTHGHPVGDTVLKEFAALVSRNIRADDVLARWGGEEFTVLCRHTDLIKASILGERIRHEVSTYLFAGDLGLKVTVSVGIAALPDADLNAPQLLLEAADQALYEAKERGRNCVVARRKRS